MVSYDLQELSLEEKEGYALAIRGDLELAIEKEAFKKHMKDILEYRTMEYYRRRYEKKDDLQTQR